MFLHLRRQGLTPHYVLDKQEVDFFWENGQPVNVCLDFDTMATRQREIKGMTAALQMLDLPAGRILIRDRNGEIKIADKTIFVQPAWSYFLEKN